MPDSLVDIGGGFKVVNPDALIPSANNALEQYKNTLSILDLTNRIKDAPIESKKKEVDLAIGTNTLLNIDVDNALKRAQLNSAVNKERRDQADFFTKQATDTVKLFQQDPNLGRAALENAFPGATVSQTLTGAFVADIPVGKGSRKVLIDPNRIADPQQRITFENQEKDDFSKNPVVTGFQQQSDAYKKMTGLKDQATGASDVGILYSYIKLLDPTSAVREGEIATAQNTNNIPTNIVNLYNRALSEGGPIFGEKGSAARQNILNAGKVIYDTSRQNVINLGQNTYKIAESRGLTPQNTLIPVGDVKINDFIPDEDLSRIPTQALEAIPTNQLTNAQLKELIRRKQLENAGPK